MNAIKKPEELFRLAVETSPTGKLLVNEEGLIVFSNTQLNQLFGYLPEELSGKPVEVLIPKRFQRDHLLLRRSYMETPKTRVMGVGRELYGLRKDGTEFPISVGLNYLNAQEGRFVMCSIVDVTTQREAERALQESEARYRALFEESPISLWEEDFSAPKKRLQELTDSGVTDLAAYLKEHPEEVRAMASSVKIWAANRSTLKTFESNEEPKLPSELTHILDTQALDFFREELIALANGASSFKGETQTRTLTGRTNTIYFWLRILPGYEDTWSRVVVSVADITTDKEVEQQLRASLREKEVLLKEIHHRVKNNLQVISSLLNLQSNASTDPKIRQIFMESQNRVRSIALVHERLYQSKDLSYIKFAEHAKILVDGISYSMGAPHRNISIKLQIEDIAISVDTAIPCGLLINELVTNAIKHAFPHQTEGGEIVVALKRSGQALELVVSDNGVGLPQEIDLSQANSLGFSLVYTFADQLQANIKIQRSPGATFSFRFNEVD